ncbi:Uncharacterised protein [Mycobacteroides abscessus subsp. abscessus]|nr:Uncharacterised protein [Mycobacteroides abscessus subsp. abscessus]
MNSGSTWDFRQVSSISSSAGMRASGMNLPPNAPKYGPVSVVSVMAVLRFVCLRSGSQAR